ncbi:acyltransferase [Neptunomonas sp.]|uniref:acyltransferase family protein n=1 Tax=Neptunomonas sp. TaxID=1971898 RepID=UPI0025E7E05C|nr:acyltransferase [Neptunomonas sp.]
MKTIDHRFYELDVLRFIAAFFVVLYHYAFRMWNMESATGMPFPFLSQIFKYGYLGVDAFFIISGFVIIMSADNRSVSSFISSRIVRLYPAYWVCTIFVFIGYIVWTPLVLSDNYLDFIVNFTMFHSWFSIKDINPVYWTLAIELQFYIIIALVIYLKVYRFFSIILGVWLLVSISSYYFDFNIWIKTIFMVEWSHYFIVGCVFYLIRRDGISLYKLLLVLLALYQSLKLSYWYMLLKERLTSVDFNPIVGLSFIVILYAFFTLMSLGKIRFDFKAVSAVGVLTYPLYLIHTLGQIWLEEYLNDNNKYFLIFVIVIIMLFFSWLINKYLEIPLAKRLKYLLPKINK